MKKVLILFLVLFYCKQKEIELSFYFWKSNFYLSEIEKKTLIELNSKKIFIKFFDVDKESEEIIPKAILTSFDKLENNFQFVPVIYITNRTWNNLEKEKIKDLCEKIYKKIHLIAKEKKFNEIQFDSDWSKKTKDNFFYFLEEFKKFNSNYKISTTIRLHQVKYFHITGIPPVNEGYLMFYNMGKLNLSSNSILNETDYLNYTDSLKKYPLKLNLILPIYSWLIHTRNDKIENLIRWQNVLELYKENFVQDKNNFEVKKDFIYEGIFFKERDVLKLESINEIDLLKACEVLTKKIRNWNQILFFDLDESNLNRLNYDKIIKIRNCFM